MAKAKAVEVFLEKGATKCLKDYKQAYLLLVKLDLMYPALRNTLDRSLWDKFQKVKAEALRKWGSDDVQTAFDKTKEWFTELNLRKYRTAETK